MIRRSIGMVFGLGLVVAVACGDGGTANGLGGEPSDNPPAGIFPRNPNEPPGFRDNAPIGAEPPSPPGVPGTQPPGEDCFDLCADARAAGCDVDGEGDDCEGDCERTPAVCFAATVALARCIIDVGCDEDFIQECVDEFDELDLCQNDPDDPGQGGQGPM